MRIAHVSDCFLPRLGGIEVQVATLAGVQQAAGHQVSIVTATPGDDVGREIAVHRVVAPVPFELPLHPRGGWHVGRVLRAEKPDVVHVHVGAVSPFAWTAARRAIRDGVPTVVTVHSMWDPVTLGIYRAFESTVGWSRWGLVVTAVSEAAAAPIRRSVAGGFPVTVVPNGIEPARWRRPDRGPVAGGGVHVVAVGRLAPRKQPVTLLRLLRRAHRRLGDASGLRATVVGDGPARAAMQRYLRRHGMDDWVTLAGRLDRTEIAALLGSADMFLAPAALESFGIAALEARLAGLPVVARAGNGISDFVHHGREGLLGGDDEEMVDALVRLAAEPGLRQRISAHNRSTEPARCVWPAVLEAFDGCYAQAQAPVGSSR